MQRFFLYFFFITSFFLSAFSQAKETDISTNKQIAITFDDSPRFARGKFDGPTRAALLVKNLALHNVKETAFFCVGSQGNKPFTEEGKTRLQTFSDAGHIIANHTYSHININDTSASDYIEEIKKAEEVLESYPSFIKWFRFPYLREGNTLEKRDEIRTYLKDQGYFNAYVTVSTYDWAMESIFQREYKNNPQIDMEKVRDFFVSTTISNIETADANAQNLLNRSPKHVLLLHETDLVALFIGDLVDALRDDGWQIISPKEAYTDPIADFALKSVHPYNPGRIGEMAISNPDIRYTYPPLLDQEVLEARFTKMVLSD